MPPGGGRRRVHYDADAVVGRIVGGVERHARAFDQVERAARSAVTMTGAKGLVGGAEFGSGNRAATGLVRLPNTGAVKWRKADGSGDLGIALNANDHLAADAIIDFAPGQTFGAFSYPDAGYGNKGIVQVDAAGGLAVESGVLSIAPSGASPGTYSKVTVDSKGRVTTGANLAAGDLPGHTHTATDIVSGELPHKVQKDGADVGTRRALNLIQGSRVSISAADDPANDRVSVTIGASPPEAGEITNALGYVPANRAGEHFAGPIDCGACQPAYRSPPEWSAPGLRGGAV